MSEERRIDQDWPIIYAHTSRGGGTGGWKHFAVDAVAGVAVTLIPDDEDDVVTGIAFLYSGRTSGGVGFSGAATCANGATVNLYNVAGNTFVLAVAANGSMTVQRTGGALTYSVGLLGVWQ